MKRQLILLIPILTVIFLISGCYTKLAPLSGEETRDYDDANYHELYGFSHYYYPWYWETYPRWGRYYAVPWWWDYYWYDDEVYYYEEEGSPRSPQSEKAVRRGTGWQQAEPADLRAPLITRGSSSGTSSTAPSAKQKKVEEKKESETTRIKEAEDDKKDDKKPTRQSSGRRRK